MIETVNAANNGVSWSLDPSNNIIDSIRIEDDLVSTTILKEAWGGYLKIKAQSKAKSKEFEKIALTGAKLSNPPTAVYLSDGRLPLVMVGESSIKGSAFISDKGVKAGVIAGNYYTGTTLINGSISATNGLLPRLDADWITENKKLIDNDPQKVMIMEVERVVKNSFLDPTLVMYSRNDLIIIQELVGNVIIKSDSEIRITSSAKLTDVLVVAEKVTIEKGFTGSIHVLADLQIKVEENVILNYPSSLVVLDSNKDRDKIMAKGEEPIHIASDSSLEGVIIYSSDLITEGRSNIAISISEDALIRGSVYSTSNIELYGTILGNVYAKHFITNDFGGRYINHLYNGTIDALRLPTEFCGLPFETEEKGVVQWLY